MEEDGFEGVELDEAFPSARWQWSTLAVEGLAFCEGVLGAGVSFCTGLKDAVMAHANWSFDKRDRQELIDTTLQGIEELPVVSPDE